MGTIIPPWSDFNYCRLKDSWVIKKKPTGGYGETRKGGTEKRSLRGDGETHSRGGRRNAQNRGVGAEKHTVWGYGETHKGWNREMLIKGEWRNAQQGRTEKRT